MGSSFTRLAFDHPGPITRDTARAYFYDREDVLGEVKLEGVWARSYVNGPGIDDYISMTVTGCGGEAEYFYRADGLGSVTGLTGRADAGVVAQYEYGPFGEAKVIAGEAVAALNPHQYTGRDLDAETGLMYYRSRYYSPGMGRFVGEDRWEGITRSPMTYLNKYIYCANNVTALTDSLGNWGENYVYDIQLYWRGALRGDPILAFFLTPEKTWRVRDYWGGIIDFGNAYYDFIDANWINSDRYFHCRANCEASRRGPAGISAAENLSNFRMPIVFYLQGPAKE